MMKKRSPMLFALAAWFVVTACRGPVMDQEEASRWIAAYAPERVTAGRPLRVELTGRIPRFSTPDDDRLKHVGRFSPSLRGEWRRADDRTLEFVPAEGAMRPGRCYTCRLNLSSLARVDSLRDFEFGFQALEREMRIEVGSLRVDPSDARYMVAEGVLHFSEPVEEKQIDAGWLHCDIEGRKAEAAVRPTDDACRYAFTLSRIGRLERECCVHVSFEGDKMAFENPEPQLLSIPGLADFRLLSAKRHDAADPYIELEFSAPLDAAQEPDGLIAVDRIEKLRFERHGTTVKVFYGSNALPELVLRVSELLRSRDGVRLGREVEQRFEAEVIPPAVEIPVRGTILPDRGDLTLPFRAVNLAAVDVEVVRIFTDNVLHYLQENPLGSTDGLRRAGRIIYRRTVRLDGDPALDLHRWQNFSIDLKNLFRQERGAIYNIRLSFRRDYSLYGRTDRPVVEPCGGLTREDRDLWDTNDAYIYRSAPDFDRRLYDWDEEDDPSKPSYYMVSDRMPEHNVVASDLGLVVKRAEGDRLWTAVTDLRTARARAGVRVTAYNYQLRVIGSGTTDAQGFADFDTKGRPHVVTASDGLSTTYLQMEYHEPSASSFDVGGRSHPEGLKYFVYGERGIWRPGDEIHLTLMVEDRRHALPAGHPVTVELYNPDDQLCDSRTLTRNVDGIYAFTLRTDEQAPTGRWWARFLVGGRTFRHPVRIETVKPNRLKIKINAPEVLHGGCAERIGIESRWLTGNVARGLDARMEMTLVDDRKPFAGYEKYCFSNPLYSFGSATHTLTERTLDSLGCLSASCTLPQTDEAPGLLRAILTAYVREAGGDESVAALGVRYSPYSAYVGVDLGTREFECDRDLRLPLVVLSPLGKPLGDRELEYKVYRLDWSWWREGSAEELSRYVQRTSTEVVAQGTLRTAEGRAELPLRIDCPAWGKYLVYVRDLESGHAAGGEVFIDWPDWRGHAGRPDPSSAEILSFALDSRSYEVGQTATVYLPAAVDGRVLLSVENGSRVVSRRWVDVSGSREVACKLPVTKDMAPNFYVHALLLQPHARVTDDLPLRLYGIQGAEVIDRRTILQPVIEVADEVAPEREFTVKVREKEGKPMSYTLAIVDEGLLDITSFKTPDPWRAIKVREALGVRTWDMFDEVIGARNGRFRPVLSVGGDEALRRAANREKRFDPVVKFLGPFTLKGGTKTHRITLPMYTGSVRVMVVAARNGSYGHADRTVAVRAPLMLLPTLPRTLAVGDRVKLPVNLFAETGVVREAEVTVRAEGAAAVRGASVKKVTFAASDRQMVDFDLQCSAHPTGRAKITVTAAGGGQICTRTVHIDVSNPLPEVLVSRHAVLKGGEKETIDWTPFDDGTARLEVTAMPAIDFGRAFDFVEHYGHDCTEQLSSRAMFLLYARRFLDAKERARAERLLPGLLKRIASRQRPDGGMAYWPGARESHPWVTSMAGEVLTEARRQGFAVARLTLDRWTEFQKSAAGRYLHSTDGAADLVQAYRLYTLALAGQPATAAMNKLRESRQLSRQATFRLAAAYSVAGRENAARALMEKARNTASVDGDYGMFWSPLRDRAMELEAELLAGQPDRCPEEALRVAADFSARPATTQQVAFVAAAMGRLADAAGEGKSLVRVTERDRSPVELRDIRGSVRRSVDPGSGRVTVENCGKSLITASLLTSRRPSAGEVLPAEAHGLKLTVRYVDSEGREITVDRLRQGQEFAAEISVTKQGGASHSLALTCAVPSGWEIRNDRLTDGGLGAAADHTDIRDDRIIWYFGLPASGTKSLTVRLRAAWCGRFTLPPVVCEDMYAPDCTARTANRKVEVFR